MKAILGRLILACLLSTVLSAAEMTAPDGYEVRDFGPLGGQVIVPKAWFVNSGTQGLRYVFLVSKEDPKVGDYDTGWRIQWLVNVRETGKINPSDAVKQLVARSKAREKVVRECEPETLGEFSRQCLETIGAPVQSKPGKQYHVIYSFYWSDEKDMLIAATFGAPIEEWEEAAKVYRVIKDFKLVDWSRVDPRKKPVAR